MFNTNFTHRLDLTGIDLLSTQIKPKTYPYREFSVRFSRALATLMVDPETKKASTVFEKPIHYREQEIYEKLCLFFGDDLGLALSADLQPSRGRKHYEGPYVAARIDMLKSYDFDAARANEDHFQQIRNIGLEILRFFDAIPKSFGQVTRSQAVSQMVRNHWYLQTIQPNRVLGRRVNFQIDAMPFTDGWAIAIQPLTMGLEQIRLLHEQHTSLQTHLYSAGINANVTIL